MILPSAHGASVLKFEEPHFWCHAGIDLTLPSQLSNEELLVYYTVVPKYTRIDELVEICTNKIRTILLKLLTPQEYVAYLSQKGWDKSLMNPFLRYGIKCSFKDNGLYIERNIYTYEG